MNTLHPASVAVRSVSRSLNTGLLFFVIGLVAAPGSATGNLLVIGGMVLVGILVGIVYEFAYYKRFRYELTADTFDVASGVLARRDREVPLGRIQNVDVRQTLFSRTLGLAAVHIETAGGGQTEVTLQYVDDADARRLRRQLRQGAVDTEGSETDSEDDRTPDEEEELLFEMQPRELAILSAFTIDPGASLLGGIALSFASGFDPGTLIPFDLLEDLPGTGAIAVAWAILLFVAAAWIVSALLTINRYYGFRLTRVGDELYYERGLVQRYSGTIPLDKVQTLTITESVPFRWFGYGSLAVETAGYAPGQAGGRGAESAIPLAGRDRVLTLAHSIEPFGELAFERPPRRARERYAVRYGLLVALLAAVGFLVVTATTVEGPWYALLALAVLVPIGAHLKWSNRGYRLDEEALLTRTGFFRRTTKIVPYYRVQSIVHTQTIFQRSRQLASVTADTASSASFFGRAGTAYDLDADTGLALQTDVETRLQDRLRVRERTRRTERLRRSLEGDESASESSLDSSESTNDSTETGE